MKMKTKKNESNIIVIMMIKDNNETKNKNRK